MTEAPDAVAILDPPTPEPVRTPIAETFPRTGPALFAAIRASGARKVVLQVPAGLTRNAHVLAGEIREATGAQVALLARACFGACDLPSDPESVGADLAVVLGHAPIPNVRLTRPTFFVEMRETGGDAERLADLVVGANLPDPLGLVASVQHLDLVPNLIAALAQRGRTVRIAAGGPRLQYPGQALGCNYTTATPLDAEVGGFLFLGTGRFHPIGLAFSVEHPVFALDPLQGLLEGPIDRDALVRRRQLAVATARDARRWGVLVSTFPGQHRSAMALALQRRALDRGREAEILTVDRIDPRDLEGRDLDAYVSTACPRIATDDGPLYPKPVLTPPEFLMALGELPLAPYRFDTYR